MLFLLREVVYNNLLLICFFRGILMLYGEGSLKSVWIKFKRYRNRYILSLFKLIFVIINLYKIKFLNECFSFVI